MSNTSSIPCELITTRQVLRPGARKQVEKRAAAGTGREREEEASVASAVSSSRQLTRGPDGRFAGSSTTGSAKPAGPPADSVEMRIYEYVMPPSTSRRCRHTQT